MTVNDNQHIRRLEFLLRKWEDASISAEEEAELEMLTQTFDEEVISAMERELLPVYTLYRDLMAMSVLSDDLSVDDLQLEQFMTQEIHELSSKEVFRIRMRRISSYVAGIALIIMLSLAAGGLFFYEPKIENIAMVVDSAGDIEDNTVEGEDRSNFARSETTVPVNEGKKAVRAALRPRNRMDKHQKEEFNMPKIPSFSIKETVPTPEEMRDLLAFATSDVGNPTKELDRQMAMLSSELLKVNDIISDFFRERNGLFLVSVASSTRLLRSLTLFLISLTLWRTI